MKAKQTSILIAAIATLLLIGATACGPAALEAKRMADQCNATYGFNTPRSLACMNSGQERLAMAGSGAARDL